MADQTWIELDYLVKHLTYLLGNLFKRHLVIYTALIQIDGFLDYRAKGKQFQVLPSKSGKHDPNYNRIFEVIG
jgi:hypothetical protein